MRRRICKSLILTVVIVARLCCAAAFCAVQIHRILGWGQLREPSLMSVFAAGDGKERERERKSIRRPWTDWNERFSSLCGVLKGIKEQEEGEE